MLVEFYSHYSNRSRKPWQYKYILSDCILYPFLVCILFVYFHFLFLHVCAYCCVINLIKHTFCRVYTFLSPSFPPTCTAHSFSGCHVVERSGSAWCGSDKRDGVCCWKQTDVVNVKHRRRFIFLRLLQNCALAWMSFGSCWILFVFLRRNKEPSSLCQQCCPRKGCPTAICFSRQVRFANDE